MLMYDNRDFKIAISSATSNIFWFRKKFWIALSDARRPSLFLGWSARAHPLINSLSPTLTGNIINHFLVLWPHPTPLKFQSETVLLFSVGNCWGNWDGAGYSGHLLWYYYYDIILEIFVWPVKTLFALLPIFLLIALYSQTPQLAGAVPRTPAAARLRPPALWSKTYLHIPLCCLHKIICSRYATACWAIRLCIVKNPFSAKIFF